MRWRKLNLAVFQLFQASMITTGYSAIFESLVIIIKSCNLACIINKRSKGSECNMGRSATPKPSSGIIGNILKLSAATASIRLCGNVRRPKLFLIAISQNEALLRKILFDLSLIITCTLVLIFSGAVNHHKIMWVSNKYCMLFFIPIKLFENLLWQR